MQLACKIDRIEYLDFLLALDAKTLAKLNLYEIVLEPKRHIVEFNQVAAKLASLVSRCEQLGVATDLLYLRYCELGICHI